MRKFFNPILPVLPTLKKFLVYVSFQEAQSMNDVSSIIVCSNNFFCCCSHGHLSVPALALIYKVCTLLPLEGKRISIMPAFMRFSFPFRNISNSGEDNSLHLPTPIISSEVTPRSFRISNCLLRRTKSSPKEDATNVSILYSWWPLSAPGFLWGGGGLIYAAYIKLYLQSRVSQTRHKIWTQVSSPACKNGYDCVHIS
jgi:hypothetical protein